MIKIKQENGVTLVGLVIAIIVLGILVSITFSASGGKKPINEAKSAAKDSEISNGVETLQEYYVEATDNSTYGNITEEQYIEFVKQKGLSTGEKDGKKLVELNGYIYEISIDSNEHFNANFKEKGNL